MHLTVTMTIFKSELSFSKLKLIKLLLEECHGQIKTDPPLALLSIEIDRAQEIDFNNNIDEFTWLGKKVRERVF